MSASTYDSELFPGFQVTTLEGAEGVRLRVCLGGQGEPVVLLHGFPQTHATWHRVAPELAKHYRVIVPDLRGYGDSDAPPGDANHRRYSKRAMGQDILKIMRSLGHERFAVAGHDRGARVAYRLALDEPQSVSKLAVLDVIPTLEVWRGADKAFGLSTYHWYFLAQPNGLPEALLSAAPNAFLYWTLRAWSGPRAEFDPRALAEYRRCFSRLESLHAQCEDYRAGAGVDAEDDASDEQTGKKIACPVLALWGEHGTAHGASVLETWKRWATTVTGHSLPCGHFLPEEAPSLVVAALRDWLQG